MQRTGANGRRSPLSDDGRGRSLPSRLLAGVTGIALVAGGSVVFAPGTALAAPVGLTVSSTADIAADAGACGDPGIVAAPPTLSLREATCIANNQGGEVAITVPAGRYDLLHGELRLGATSGSRITLTGAGAASTVIDAGARSRVLDLDFNQVGGVSTSISGVTIRGGADATFGGAGIIGGSNLNADADSLTIDASVLTDNHSTADPAVTNQMGGGLQFLGGSLRITNSVISNNSSGSSRGSGVSYEANGDASPESLQISGTTFSNNTVTADAGGLASGGALAVAGTAGQYEVTDSRFVGNRVVGTGTATPRGAAIWSESGNLTVRSSSFTGNVVSGGHDAAGGAIAVDTGSLVAQFNRFTDNGGSGSALRVGSGVPADATLNWWGCNTGPNTAGCDSTLGTLTATPRLVLSATASPSTLAGPDATSTVTAALTRDSNGGAVAPSSLGAFTGTPVTWGNVGPSGATVTPTNSLITAGSATTSYDSNAALGSGGVDATLDNGVSRASLTVQSPPSFTSPTSTAFTTRVASSFTVTTAGSPAPQLVLTTPVPPGVTFTDNGDGTATFAGTPTAAGTHQMQVLARNGVHADVPHTLTIDIGEAPTFTSPATAIFRTGTAGNFVVTTVGTPVPAISSTGTLPPGMTITDDGNGTATLSGTPTQTGSFPLQLTASNGLAPSGVQTLTVVVNSAPVITNHPTRQTVEIGASTTFTAAATGVPAPTVQWQHSTDGGATFTNIAGATSTSYTFTALAGDNGKRYRAVFTNAAGTNRSFDALLLVGTAPSFTSADHATFPAGTPGSFAISATGIPAPILIRDGADLPGWATLTDNGDGTGTITGTPPPGSGGTHNFTLGAVNGFSPNASQTFTLTVDEAPVVTGQPVDRMAAPGSSVTFSVTAAGFPVPSVQWQKSTDAGVTFTDIANETANALTFVVSSGDDASRYRALVRNTAGQSFSNAARLSVAAAPGAPVIGTASAFDGGASVAFTPPASDGGAPITGYTVTSSPGNRTATGTGSPLVVAGLTNGTAYTFTVRATNAAGEGAPSAPSNAVRPVAPTPIAAKYAQLGGAGSALGVATGPEYRVAGGTAQDFRFGRIYHSPATGAHEVHGVIAARYAALGGPAGWLGFPVSDETATAGGTGAFNHFAGGNGASIYWSPKSGAWSVHGAIRTKWLAMGAERGVLGFPVSDETPTPGGTGAFNHFAGGDNASIYWSPKSGAWSVHGQIRVKWLAMGAERSVLGFPVTDETATAGRTGRFNHFAGGDGASIFWSPRSGAWSVHGAIRTKWVASGAERGRLGYPVSDEYGVSGGRRNDFVGGSVGWRFTGSTTVSYR